MTIVLSYSVCCRAHKQLRIAVTPMSLCLAHNNYGSHPYVTL